MEASSISTYTNIQEFQADNNSKLSLWSLNGIWEIRKKRNISNNLPIYSPRSVCISVISIHCSAISMILLASIIRTMESSRTLSHLPKAQLSISSKYVELTTLKQHKATSSLLSVALRLAKKSKLWSTYRNQRRFFRLAIR